MERIVPAQLTEAVRSQPPRCVRVAGTRRWPGRGSALLVSSTNGCLARFLDATLVSTLLH